MDAATLDHLAHANFVEYCRETTRWGGAEGALAEAGGVVRYATGTAFPAVTNGVFRLDPSVPAAEVLDGARAWFGERGRGFTVWVRAGDERDADLVAAAEAGGLLLVLEEPEMVCTERVDTPAVDGVELRWMTDVDEVAAFTELCGEAYAVYGMPEATVAEMVRRPEALLEPHLHTVLAWEGDRLVATAQVLLSHGVAGIYWVATRTEARGRGLGEAVTAAVTNRGLDAGAAAVTLQASPMGEPIYTRMGFRTVYRYHGWVAF